MSRIVMVILIYHLHKAIDLINNISFHILSNSFSNYIIHLYVKTCWQYRELWLHVTRPWTKNGHFSLVLPVSCIDGKAPLKCESSLLCNRNTVLCSIGIIFNVHRPLPACNTCFTCRRWLRTQSILPWQRLLERGSVMSGTSRAHRCSYDGSVMVLYIIMLISMQAIGAMIIPTAV
jgi:hypothetical protein